VGFSVHFFVGFWKSIFPQIPITARAPTHTPPGILLSWAEPPALVRFLLRNCGEEKAVEKRGGKKGNQD